MSHRMTDAEDVRPLILFIDANDSFSNNIISCIEITLNVRVCIVKIDNPLLQNEERLHEELRKYYAVICGPGPGRADNEHDVGLMDKIWALSDQHLLPVLGICLGFQSLCLNFGGQVLRLKGPQHGIIRKLAHVGNKELGKGTIFDGVGEIRATLYQSLCMDLGHVNEALEDWENQKWKPTSACTDLQPLAWAEWDEEENDSGMKDKRILVAVQHREKPFWGLQYHPESICTNEESIKVIKNWGNQAIMWNQTKRQSKIINSSHANRVGIPAVRPSLLSQSGEATLKRWAEVDTPHGVMSDEAPNSLAEKHLECGLDDVYRSLTVKLPAHISVADILEVVQGTTHYQILLESSNSHEINAEVKGRYSIIGMYVKQCLRVEYTTGDSTLKIHPGGEENTFHLDLERHGGAWPILANYVHRRKTEDGNPDSPFWGGFMGYTTYEMGLESISVENCQKVEQPTATNSPITHPDLSFAWVTRSLVLDHEKGLIYIQDISARTDAMPEWINHTAVKLLALCNPDAEYHLPHLTWSKSTDVEYSSSASSSKGINSPALPSGARSSLDSARSDSAIAPHTSSILSLKRPSDNGYEAKVSACQSYISAGESYELCLTDVSTITRPCLDSHYTDHSDLATNTDSWSFYRTLRTRQPAPFASYIRLGAATLVSASPERFLSWTADGKCELRPMKGTVRKSPEVSTLEQAKTLLDVPKEKAENLMIVDLVRHDLHGICGSGNVTVPRLMVVEEYKSVFQMISIVQGQIPKTSDHMPHTGIDVLAASLPPGSMTGAPKKRSCEILRGIEKRERGMYSGVVGYMDVGGRGDFSVTIRCMFRWEDEKPDDGDTNVETWHVAAGGAVTTLSTPVGEREEMRTKMAGTLGIFE